jgi:hypothetical protein
LKALKNHFIFNFKFFLSSLFGEKIPVKKKAACLSLNGSALYGKVQINKHLKIKTDSIHFFTQKKIKKNKISFTN